MTLVTKATLSAKDFRNPLLKVLGQLTQHQAHVLVANDSTYDPVLTVMGITQDQYGFEQATGSPWTQRWTQWAFQWLKEKKLGVTSGRGKWGLTPAGVAQALTLNGGQTVAPIAAPVVAAVAAPPVNNHLLEGTYHPDPYIQHVGLTDHKCYGFYSSQSPVCPDCTARVLCQEKRVNRIREIVAMFALEDSKATAPAATTPTPVLRPPTLGGKAGATVSHMINQSPVRCRGCETQIEIGEDASWVRGLGDKGKSSAMYHKRCYEDAKG